MLGTLALLAIENAPELGDAFAGYLAKKIIEAVAQHGVAAVGEALGGLTLEGNWAGLGARLSSCLPTSNLTESNLVSIIKGALDTLGVSVVARARLDALEALAHAVEHQGDIPAAVRALRQTQE